MRQFIIFLLSVYPAVVHAQPQSPTRKLIEFGTVTSEELKMTAYERDSSAQAVVLFDKGYFNGNRFTFTRHVRVKILTNAGASFANFSIRAPSKGFIDGFTFNLEGGIVQKTKLAKSNIFEEEIIDGFDIYKIFFPNVKPGSVIDLQYTHQSLPFEWRFQELIPVVYSELTIEPTTYVQFKKVFYGFEKIYPLKNNRWIAEHVPSIAIEPLMTHYSNYITRFQFDVESVSFPGFYKEYSSSWEAVGARLMASSHFGAVISESFFLKEKAKLIEASQLSLSEKISDAFNYIQTNIKWNKSFDVLSHDGYREDFKNSHSGNSATVNLLLISLLKKAGIKVYPVILSTRDHGLINPVSASMEKINYVVAYVDDSGTNMLLDATSPDAIPGILPEHCLNGSGWVIRPDGKGEIIDLTPARGNVLKQFVLIKANENNQLVAEVQNTYEDYGFLKWIEKYRANGSVEEHAAYLKSEMPTAGIFDYKLLLIDTLNLKGSEKTFVNLDGSDYLQSIGSNEYMLNPYIFSDIQNPFKAEMRQFPIDFICPQKRVITVSMMLPPEFEFKSMPQSNKLDFPGDGAKFTFLCNASNNVLNIRCDMSMGVVLFGEQEYKLVKTFFSEVVKKLNESILIVKKT
jgi:hypothetical protein